MLYSYLQLWSTIRDDQLTRFTREARDPVPSGANANKPIVCISTYSMVAYTGKRTYVAEEAMRYIESREWGLVILDGISFCFNFSCSDVGYSQRGNILVP